MEQNTVKKYTDLFRLKKVQDGKIYEVEETGKFYIRNGHNWDEMSKAKIKEGFGTTIDLYTINQNSVMQFQPLSEEELIDKYYEKITDWFNSINQNYYMLLSSRYNYYTLFARKEYSKSPSFANAVLDIISDFSKVYSVDLDKENNGWEIWACLNEEDKAPEVFYLFPYEAGVIFYD